MTLFDKTWWLEHGATYKDEFVDGPAYAAQEQAVLDVLAPLDFESVMEVGCGFGRITKRVRDAFPNGRYMATDVSEAALTRAIEHLDAHLLDLNINFAVFDLEEDVESTSQLPHSDLVIAAEVLMHRTAEQVIVDVEQLAALSTKYVLTVDWFQPGAGPAAGCYQHDYATLFMPFGSVTRIDIPEARQAIWLLTKEPFE